MSTRDCYPERAAEVDTLLDTLDDPLRRAVIYYFENRTGDRTASLDEVVGHIESRVPEHVRGNLAVGLTQVHLPKLQSRGWLDYDPRSTEITYYGHQGAEELLEDVRDIFT